ncbi:hypothetical protein [Nocardia gipuzkoensis]|uniref:hypothetical protein n=1 Tax=Nocardia gipuzkoensis TaxID=2749991 RepID=UPI00237E9E72|nr:hypothetical protein [Nocardia gipuzkoensis]MDE1675036.1 hypothetical protein [Nocardia gipuzkoensis]
MGTATVGIGPLPTDDTVGVWRRCCSLGYQIGSILGGGLAPTLATALYAACDSSAPVTAYPVVVSLVSLACLAVVTRDVRRRVPAAETPTTSDAGNPKSPLFREVEVCS